MNRSITVARNTSKSSSIRETGRYINKYLVQICPQPPRAVLIFVRKKVVKDSRLGYNVAKRISIRAKNPSLIDLAL